ncbi:prolyl 4-hydroxylase subunit alpha-2-like [Drosophila eugracilis]|uniref:prolyl 4-hydroxylase subunit alpha-2-like n=1 Tax=Drosophila eugracilis TaxID=29029 RepID=UPI001BDAB513|nr:prolyl 4-hydroxylase subunit alpha-2-like [Drosophila eugracilis]
MFLRSFNIVLLSFIFILLTTLSETEEIEEDKPKEVIYSNSIRALSELREIENSYLEHLASYVSSLSQKVENLRTFIDSVTGSNLNSKTDPIQYVSNPLNSFGLVRRAHEDWPKFIAYTKIFKNLTVENEELQKLVNRTPSADDMREALLGMHRIEHFYDLKSSDMANGLLAGGQLGTRMTVPDCVALADFMYNQSEFRRSAEWYRLALSALNELQNSTASPFHIPNPDDLRKKFIMSRLQEGSINNLSDYLMELTQDREIPLIHLRPNPTLTAIERGCRGEFPPGPQLVCRYNSTTTPFMRIAPLKEEEISRNPLIWLYHDVIYDSEIAQLTNMTRKEMTQGTTNNYTTSGQVSRLFHVKVTDDDGGKLDKTLVNRMADISGLDVGNSTSLARINYGLGSYFPEHSDYVDIKNHPEFTEEGDRLMTFLFYLTDVPVGGSTIFPAAELAIQPKKGSALFWYNLHNDGEPNPLTRHAVCPMIMGNRWVLVKSMLNYEQMFTKPCYK